MLDLGNQGNADNGSFGLGAPATTAEFIKQNLRCLFPLSSISTNFFQRLARYSFILLRQRFTI
jgi:hypothetical protein